MRLIVIDQSLRTLKGHHFNYGLAIYRAARRHGIETRFLCHRECSIEILNELPSEPLFSVDTYSLLVPPNGPQETIAIENYRRHCEMFHHELSTLVTQLIAESDHLLFHTIQLPELDAITEWYRTLPIRPRISIILRFDYLSGFIGRLLPDRSREIHLHLIRKLHDISPNTVHFLTDTTTMQNEFQESGVPVTLVPIPLHGARDEEPENTGIVFLGDAYPHKGFHLVVESLPSIIARFPTARFTIQTTGSSIPTDHLRGYSQIRFIDHRPDDREYYGILSGASALLLPYDPSIYRAQSSHIFIEGVIQGVPVISSDNGSIAPELRRHQLDDFVFTPWTPAALEEIVCRFLADPESAIRRFRERIAPLASFHTPEHFIATLLKERRVSPLERIIPGEIAGDEFADLIEELVQQEEIRTILEIGSSAGGGSTEAFVRGIRRRKTPHPTLYCMEVSRSRFRELSDRYRNDPFVSPWNVSSVPVESFPTPEEVCRFYDTVPTTLNRYPRETVLGWLLQDMDYIAESGVPQNGIELIKRSAGIDTFDMVLIDGSEFTGSAELDLVYGARWILLDDINAFKNYNSYQRLLNDPRYELYRENWHLRNGYAVFRLRAQGDLPIHFLTIVLNGIPFIRFHLDQFLNLTIPWHWHVVEGVAELVNDTAWSLPNGGKVPDQFHENGLSIDGTSEYLDDIARRYPDRVTIYRPPRGRFWHGKREMVSAPLERIREEALLWQIDADELWEASQIETMHRMFLDNPEKSAAYFWCHFFVGRDRLVSSRNCYSQNPAFEWLRVWRYRPGDVWVSHEPPRLVRTDGGGGSVDVAAIDPFTHDQTERAGLVFQHYAYVLPRQLRFKEEYYGYRGAVDGWRRLQHADTPVFLREYFPWVNDATTVDTLDRERVTPLFPLLRHTPRFPRVMIDGVFFQMARTGIARCWESILERWAKTDVSRHLVLIDRDGTAPSFPGIRTIRVAPHRYDRLAEDRELLQSLADDEEIDLFISTYYSRPVDTPSLMIVHDMIPEVTSFYDLNNPMWQEKHDLIRHATRFVAVSRNTALDLVRLFPECSDRVTVIHNGVDHSLFFPATAEEIARFRTLTGMQVPYLLFVGARSSYKNPDLLVDAVSSHTRDGSYGIIFVGGLPELEPPLAERLRGIETRVIAPDDRTLRVAYSGAHALVYPSLYEGFGLPILEAFACGCPVVTTQSSSMPEVAGGAAIFVPPDDPDRLWEAITSLSNPEIRQWYRHQGMRRSRIFSWDVTARQLWEEISSCAVKVCHPPHGGAG